jgi:hypothetical protein
MGDAPGIVLRRFDREPLEIVALTVPAVAPSLEGPRGCTVMAEADGDTRVYFVTLPEGYVVRPVDWRRFATDPERVRERIEMCVRDNLTEAQFEPWSPELRDRTTAQLTLALRDLGSMIDVRGVDYTPGEEPGERSVCVEYTDVDRRHHNVTFVQHDFPERPQ